MAGLTAARPGSVAVAHADPAVAAAFDATRGRALWDAPWRRRATAGPRAGEATGRVGPRDAPRAVHQASLSPAACAAALEAEGLVLRAVMAEDEACGGHMVRLAARLPEEDAR